MTSETSQRPTEEPGAGRRVLYCHCAFARVVDEGVKEKVLHGLASSDLAFDAVPDLCELAARRDPALGRLAAEGRTEIVACYPRAVRWLFHAAEADLPEDDVTIHNMRDTEPETILDRLLGDDS
ncbi:MAG: hypothetical protein MPN21_21785 [Thermoanaerobaculia bacterium]|nr:hypothetical protein [Thermoanaerobaculia bacterium]